ncbi:MAG: hypothetical protein ACXQTR_01705 [Candidatus Methanospirareceae archaeon]
MKSSDIQTEVSSLKQEYDTLRERLNLLVQQFQNEVPSAAESWIKREVERRIEDHPDTVAALGVEKLKSLKSKMNALISSLPDVAKKETSNTAEWPQYQKTNRNDYSRGAESFFDKTFRGIISHLGALLDEFGFLTEPKGYVASWEKNSYGRIRYAINPGFDHSSVPVLTEFQAVHKEFRVLEEKLENKEKELAKTKAKELWESA